jgi:hypothetical protein
MATLLEICTAAIEGVLNTDAPTTIIGNSSPDAILLKSAANQIGRDLVRSYKWQALKATYTFNTSNGTQGYDLPSDFKRFANLTFWDRSNDWELIGPMSASEWQALNSGIVVSGIQSYFHIAGGQLLLYPTPTDARTIAYDYYSKYFCESSGGTGQDGWLADTDIALLDDELFILGVRYRYLARNGLPFSEEKADFMQALADAQYDDTPKPIIDVSGIPPLGYGREGNFPDTGYGL